MLLVVVHLVAVACFVIKLLLVVLRLVCLLVFGCVLLVCW